MNDQPIAGPFPHDLYAWLADATLRSLPIGEVVPGFCERLTSLGFPLERTMIATAALDPNVRAQSFIWHRTNTVEHTAFPHGETALVWQQSPMAMMLRTHTGMLRRRLDGTGPDDYALFAELTAEGHTDWVAYANMFHWTVEHIEGGEMGVLSSWTTKHPDGFSEAQLELLRPLVNALAATIKALVVVESACNVLSAYIGKDAGERVLRGSITRGSVTEVRAVLMFADLRGFTRFSAEQPTDVTLATLNRSFDCVGDSIGPRGGEILKFIGDGVLVVFMLDGETPDATVADRAIDAAIDAQMRLKFSGAPLSLDIALHVGTVSYGNIGTNSRLDFTVIGQAVNEVARIESLCGSLGEPILVSGELAGMAAKSATRLKPLGPQTLRGLINRIDVFALAE